MHDYNLEHSGRVMGGDSLMDDSKDRDEERFWKSMYYRSMAAYNTHAMLHSSYPLL